MKVANLNASSRKTRELIRSTFLEMLGEEGNCGNISVSGLTQRANISRSTFYTHYSNTDEIAEEIECEIFDQLLGNARVSSRRDALALVARSLTVATQRAEKHRALLRANGPLRFLGRMRDRLRQIVLDGVLPTLPPEERAQFAVDLTVYLEGVSAQLTAHARGEVSMDYDELVRRVLISGRKLLL